MSFFLESSITMSTRLSIAILLATVAFAAVPARPHPPYPPVTEKNAKSILTILAHHCDGTGAVDSLAIVTDGAGPHLITWDNEELCGRRS